MRKLKRKRFLDKSKKERKKEYFTIKNRIKKSVSEYGDKFIGDTYLNSRDKDCKSLLTWMDGFFLSSKDNSLYFNVTFLNIYSYIDDTIENMIFQDKNFHYSYNGFEKRKEELISNIESLNIELFEGVVFEKGYVSGQGATMYVNTESLTQESIEKVIDEFRAGCEKPYKKDVSFMKEEIFKNYRENFLKRGEMANPVIY